MDALILAIFTSGIGSALAAEDHSVGRDCRVAWETVRGGEGELYCTFVLFP